MRHRLVHEAEGARTFVLVLDAGDEVMTCLSQFVEVNGFGYGHITAIGAFHDATLGFFDWESKEYQEIPLSGQMEVLSLIGDVADKDGKPAVHAHVVVGRPDGSTRGGHLLQARVRPTLEVTLTQSPAHLRKKLDPESGLALIKL